MEWLVHKEDITPIKMVLLVFETYSYGTYIKWFKIKKCISECFFVQIVVNQEHGENMQFENVLSFDIETQIDTHTDSYIENE